MKVLTFLVAVIFAGCVTRESPPMGFVMHCDVCEQVTGWKTQGDYFYCTVSGTTWDPRED